jgi:thiamine phosphate synthase YjbQ (UPF0047 family)
MYTSGLLVILSVHAVTALILKNGVVSVSYDLMNCADSFRANSQRWDGTRGTPSDATSMRQKS